MPKKLRFVVTGFAQLISLGIYLCLTYLSWQFITAQYKFGQFSAALKLPMYLVYDAAAGVWIQLHRVLLCVLS